MSGARRLPYLASGSAGIGLAVLTLLNYRPASALSSALPGIEMASSCRFTINPGLFNGRSGLMLFLATLESSGRASHDVQRVQRRHAELLGVHALRHGGGMSFPSEDLLRMSSDLATGSAGVLVALDAVARSAAGRDVPVPLPDYLGLRGRYDT